MSNTSSLINCLEPDPDIAGIGVRVAIYVQALLSVVYPIFFASDGKIDEREAKTMSGVSITIVLTATALLVSTAIEAHTGGISLYHALIILELSWINSMTFLTVHFVLRAAKSIEAQRDTPAGMLWQTRIRFSEFLTSEEAVVASIHFTVVGAIGLWIWSHVASFGSQPDCNPGTIIVILSKTISVTHGPTIRRVSLAVYSIALIPAINVYVIANTLGTISSLARGILFYFVITPIIACCRPVFIAIFPCCICHSDTDPDSEAGALEIVHSTEFARWTFYFAISGMLTAMVLLIADTELMIERSRKMGIVQEGENEWTFGQTLAMVLLFLPLWEALKAIKESLGDDSSDTS
ncbi:hypothetical protein BD410DRAFT_366818 [Rickenella mellea]|uniref:Uncharacterized protein n=1 Tax=Rickenella mellea TaxID=50990 RepID=A0A4Y7Q119_9AGAM|nr:hypothetical protein BD410DRAFT_366818 [Rickenella mellea]